MNSKKVFSNMIWRMAERVGAQGVTFVLSIILARLLSPEVYGLTALVTVFTVLLQVFIDSGLGNALVQKKDSDDLDFSSVFYFNLFMGCALYLVMFFCAPFIASFYEKMELVPIIRVMSLTLVVSGVKNIQQAYVSKMMIFKRFFFSTLGGTVGAAVIGIVMAYAGLGVWALVIQNLFNTIVDTVILWITVKWRPKKQFSLYRLKVLFSYGWKLLVSSLLDTFFNNVRQLLIGKVHSSEDLAFYNKGKQFPNLIVTNIVNLSIDSVLLSAMSSEQENKVRVKDMTRRAMKTSTYIVAPMMLGMAAAARPLVRILLTDKWLPCVPFLQIFCMTFLLQPIQTANLNAIKAIGRSDVFLRLNIIKKTIDFIIIICSLKFGVFAIASSYLFSSLIGQIVNMWPNKDLLGYSIHEQIRDIIPNISLALVMAACIFPISLLNIPDILIICLQIIGGMLTYIVGSALFKLDSFQYMKNLLIRYIKK